MRDIFRTLARVTVPSRWWRSTRLRAQILDAAQGGVLSGPFAGMRYVTRSYGSVFPPKLLGTYELEWATQSKIVASGQFDHLVVAGAAEGYFAVGFARQAAIRSVVTFEPSPDARAALAELAMINGVSEKIAQFGICDCSALRQALVSPSSTFLLVDIEGGEAILLDPVAVPELRSVTMFVEIHEYAIPGIEACLRGRFASSHDIERIDARPRSFSDFPLAAVGALPATWRGTAVQAMNEGRPPGMFWLLLRPRGSEQSR